MPRGRFSRDGLNPSENIPGGLSRTGKLGHFSITLIPFGGWGKNKIFSRVASVSDLFFPKQNYFSPPQSGTSFPFLQYGARGKKPGPLHRQNCAYWEKTGVGVGVVKV